MMKEKIKRFLKILFGSIFLLSIFSALIFFIYPSCFYKLLKDEKALVLRFGKYHHTSGPGFHLKDPFNIDTLIPFKSNPSHNLQSNPHSLFPFLLTHDLNLVNLEWKISYLVTDPVKFHFVAKSPSQIFQYICESEILDILQTNNLETILSKMSGELSKQLIKNIQLSLDNLDLGLAIQQITFNQIKLPTKIQDSLKAMIEIQDEQEKFLNQAKIHYEESRLLAKGKSELEITKAKSQAQQLLTKAKIDRDNFEILYKSYKQYPQASKKILYLNTMEEILKKAKRITLTDSEVKNGKTP